MSKKVKLVVVYSIYGFTMLVFTFLTLFYTTLYLEHKTNETITGWCGKYFDVKNGFVSYSCMLQCTELYGCNVSVNGSFLTGCYCSKSPTIPMDRLPDYLVWESVNSKMYKKYIFGNETFNFTGLNLTVVD